MVVAPYTDFPQLLSVLLRMLGEGGDMAVKRDLLRLLGILGALDPHQHKARHCIQCARPAESCSVTVCLRSLVLL